MVAPVSSSNAQQPQQNAQSKTNVDKEAFLKLLMAQLKHQDPLEPVDGSEFVAQLAQFSQLEQSVTQSKQLDVISMQLTGLASNEAVGLIGKEVTVSGDRISYDGIDSPNIGISLEAPAAEVTITIRDENGDVVRTIEAGPQEAGDVSISWDGRDDNGNKVSTGSYTIQAEAVDEQGNPVSVAQEVTGTVVGVSFDKGYPEMLLDTGQTAPISDLLKVNESTSPITRQ